jgi:hypothetical protein
MRNFVGVPLVRCPNLCNLMFCDVFLPSVDLCLICKHICEQNPDGEHCKGDRKPETGKLKRGPGDVLQGMDKRARIEAVDDVKTDTTITISKLDTWSALSGLKVHKCGVIIPDSADVRLVDASSIALPSKYEFDALISVLDPRWIKNRSTSVDNVARGIAEGLIEPWCPFLNRVLSKTWWITKSKPSVAFEALPYVILEHWVLYHRWSSPISWMTAMPAIVWHIPRRKHGSHLVRFEHS